MSTAAQNDPPVPSVPADLPDPPHEEQKRLVILTADLVGYGRHMHRDSRSAIAMLKESRRILRDAAREHHGRVVSEPGDFVLAVFDEAQDAISCTVLAHAGLARRNANVAEADAAHWRMGICIGDVYEIEGDIFGQAINIAARIQAKARPGEVLVSEAVQASIPASAGLGFEDRGVQRLKNIAEPVRVFRLRWQGAPDLAPGALEATAPTLLARLKKPSVWVEAFELLSPSARTSLFARALVTEIVTILSSLANSMSVTGPEGAPAGPAVDYRLRGSVQSKGPHVRIMPQLQSTRDGSLCWAQWYDCDLRDSFDVQDEIAREVVAALQLALTDGEQAQLWKRGTASGLAWAEFQRGHDHERRYTREGHRRAKQHYGQAIGLDPNYVAPIVALAFCEIDEVRLGWSVDERQAIREAELLQRRAAAIDSHHPDVLALLAYVRLMRKRKKEAIAAIDAAVRAAPSSPEIAGYQGAFYDLIGDFRAAIRAYNRALSLSAHASPWIGSNLGLTRLAVGETGEAEHLFREVVKYHPQYYRAWLGLSVALSRLGHAEEARQAAARVVELDPDFSAAEWAKSKPFADNDLLAAFVATMHEVGLP